MPVIAGPDPYASHADALTAGGRTFAAITPSDTDDLAVPIRFIWVGVAGDLKLTLVDGSVGVFKNAPAGKFDIVRSIKKVWATGTTATNLAGVV